MSHGHGPGFSDNTTNDWNNMFNRQISTELVIAEEAASSCATKGKVQEADMSRESGDSKGLR